MRNYQPKKNNPYILPSNLYMRMLYLVRDYNRLKEEYANILHEMPHNDGMPKGNMTGDPTLEKVLKTESISREVGAVEQALYQVPQEYRKGVFDNICYGDKFPIIAGEATYRRWRCRFIYYIAKNLNQIW